MEDRERKYIQTDSIWAWRLLLSDKWPPWVRRFVTVGTGARILLARWCAFHTAL